MAEREDFHPSHDLHLDYDRGTDPHSPLWVCRVCEEIACSLCPADPEDELAVTCVGFPWFEGVTVKVGDDETLRARKSGTGWPK